MGAVDECVTPGLSKGLFRTCTVRVQVPPALGGVSLVTTPQSGFWLDNLMQPPHSLS